MTSADRKLTLRRELRARRRNLSAADQQLAAQKLKSTLLNSPYPRTHVAAYLAQDGEVDLQPFIEACWSAGIHTYLPVLDAEQPRLEFARYQADSSMMANRYGIPEPVHGPRIRPQQLDWVLLPLVGFDTRGGRLGMGGGFYDRTFADHLNWSDPPKLIGVAHECQKVADVPREDWDVALSCVVSPVQWYHTG